MSAPALPPGFQPPAPPPPPAPSFPGGAPDSPASPDEQLLALTVGKCTYQGTPVTTPEQQAWAVAKLREKIQDPQQLLGFLQSSSAIELSTMQATPVSQAMARLVRSDHPPANPVSDAHEQQVAQPPAQPPAQPTEAAPSSLPPDQLAAWDRISGQQCSTLRGLKTRLTKTHKLDWGQYCERYCLETSTGLPTGGTSQDTPLPPGGQVPTHPAPASPGLPLEHGSEGGLQATLPPTPTTSSAPTQAPQAPQPPQAPQAPQAPRAQEGSLPTVAYIGTMEDADYRTPAQEVLPRVLTWGHRLPIEPAHVAEAYDWIIGAFSGIDGITERTAPFHVYQWFGDMLHRGQIYEMPVWAPHQREQQVPMFQAAPQENAPASTPASTPAPDLGDNLISHMTEGQQQSMDFSVQTPAAASTSRAALATTLGGEVSCVFLPLLDAASTDVTRRVDANQLAGMAEVMSLQQVTDPDDLKYRKDRRVAEQMFGELLTQNPHVYVLMHGFNWVLAENLVPILLRRVTSGAIIKNGASLELKL